MSLWRLEWLRLVRTRRWIALAGPFLFFGFTAPIMTKYLNQLVEKFGGGIKVSLPETVPADGMANYVKNGQQIGLLVAVVVAAGALALDSRPEVAVFLRTRVRRAADILIPKFVVNASAAMAVFVLGGLAAWYETVVLLGHVPAAKTLAGIGYGALYMAFAVTVVAAAGGLARSTMGAVMISIAALLVMPIAGMWHVIAPWLPSYLAGALDTLARGTVASGEYVRAALVSVVVGAGLLLWSLRLLSRREL